MAVDVAEVSKLDVEPGTLPETMAAWVIRQEREGEPKDAFQIEQIEVPEPGAFEVIVRVMAAGVNFNNVWAALGKPVSVFNYGDHPEHGHHIGGSDASGIVWKVGEGVTKWKPGDEVVIHCNQASYEDVEVHGLDPLAAPSQMIWGYETTWGSFAQFTKVQAQQLLPKPRNLSWVESSAYGLTYFTAYRMLIDRCKLQAGHNVLIWGAAGRPRRVRHPTLQGGGRERGRRRLLRREGRAGQAARRRRLRQPQRVRRDDAYRREPPGRRPGRRQGALQGLARFRKAGQGDPRRRPRHRLRARRPGDLSDLGVHGEALRQGGDLRRHLGLQPRLRRPLPVDEAEGDPRLTLRQRVRVHARQPAHVRGQDSPGSLAGDGLRRRPRTPISCCTRTSTPARSRSWSAPTSKDEGKHEDGEGAIWAEVGA